MIGIGVGINRHRFASASFAVTQWQLITEQWQTITKTWN